MTNWRLLYRKQIYQLINSSCHHTPSEKQTGGKMYRHTWMTQEGRIPSATRSLKYSSVLAETHMEFHGSREMWQPIPPLTASFLSCQHFGCPGSSALALHYCSHEMWWKAVTECDPLPRLQWHNAVTACSPKSHKTMCWLHMKSLLLGGYNVSDSFLLQSFHLLDRFVDYL